MDDMCETDINLPIPNFTEDSVLSNNHTHYSDISRNVNKSRKRRREFNFLNKNNNQCLNSRVSVVNITGNNDQFANRRIPINNQCLNSRVSVVNVTGNNDQFANRRIPIIDLTNDDVMDITGQIQFIDLTNESSSNNHLIRHFELKRKLDSSRNKYSDCQFEPTRNNDSLSATHPKRHLDITRNGNSSNNSHRNNHFELTSSGNSPSNRHLINHFKLTRNDDPLSNSHPGHNFELPGNNDSSRNSRPGNHFELPGNNDSSSNSHPDHHFELPENNDSSRNSHPDHHFELPGNNDSSRNSHPGHHFELSGNKDSSRISQTNHRFDLNRNGRDTGQCSERFNFANQDGQIFIPNEPVRNLTCYNDELANYRISNMKHNNGENIAHQQLTALMDSKQQCNVNDSLPPTNLEYDIGQSIEQNIPPINLTSKVDYPNYSQPIFDPPTNNIVHNTEALNLTDKFTQSSDAIQNSAVVRKPVDIAGMYDVEVSSSKNLLTNCSKRATEINPRIPVGTSRYGVTELNTLKYNETQNMHFMQISSMQKHQCKKEIISKNSHPETKCYHQKDLRPGINGKISEMNTLDLLKPSSHPVLFRHSLGRSTVNTSKNVPIESTEVSKRGSRPTTVSSTLRRKKAKSSGGIPKQIQPNSIINFRSQIPGQAHFSLEMLKNIF